MSIQFTADEKAEMLKCYTGIAMARWAPSCWKMLNGFFFRPAADAKVLRTLLESCAGSLPCPICRKHMQDYMATKPFPDGKNETPEERQQWLVTFHNAVSARTGGTVMPAFETVAKEVTTRPIDAHVRDWWDYTLAVATLYEPHTQNLLLRNYWDSSANLLPCKLANAMKEQDEHFLKCPDSMLTALLALPDCPYPDRLSALAEFVPPAMLGATFPVTTDEREMLHRSFSMRMQGLQDIRQRATKRLQGLSSSSAVVKNTLALVANSGSSGRIWTVYRAVGIAVAVVALVVLITLIVIQFRGVRTSPVKGHKQPV
jgi:hypothetical protein